MLRRPSHSLTGLCALAALVACTRQKGAQTAPTAVATAPTEAAAAVAPRIPAPSVDVCALHVSTRANAESTKPFERDPGQVTELFSTFVSKPPTSRDQCFVAQETLASLGAQARSAGAGPAYANATAASNEPRYLDRIDAHFHLTPKERARLQANRFVVLDRLPYVSYAAAFHDIFQEQLPLYVGIDPILHAAAHETEFALAAIERNTLAPALTGMLQKMRTTLRTSGRFDATTKADLDVYLGFAWHHAKPPSTEEKESPDTLFGHDAVLSPLLSSTELEAVELFGRTRMIDFSQLVPRGHYTQTTFDPQPLQPDNYFRAMMWLTRLEWNLVSRDCRSSEPETIDQSETPREARDAMALAELVRDSNALPELALFEKTYTAFAGVREDVSVPDLLTRMQRAGTTAAAPDAPNKLSAEIGNGARRTARIHFMPEGVRPGELPVIATLFGPRIVPDVAPLTKLVNDAIPNRYHLGAADLGFALGHDSMRPALAADMVRFPTLGAQLIDARRSLNEVANGPRTNLYDAWLRTVVSISEMPRGTVPSFMKTAAYADARANSALVAFGQLRHAYVLLAAQGYDGYGCEVPDGYVEPLVPVYDALLDQMRRVREITKGSRKFENVLATLREIAVRELSGAEITRAQRNWLGMVSEYTPRGGFNVKDTCTDSCTPPTWTGWYFDLFADRHLSATKATHFVADYFTLTSEGSVAHVGAEGPRLAVFIIDENGEKRAMVGPVAKGYEVHTPIAERFDDERALEAPGKSAPWRNSFAVAANPEPALDMAVDMGICATADGVEWRARIGSPKKLGDVRLTMLDHHGDPLGPEATIDHQGGDVVVAFTLPASFREAAWGVEGVHLRVSELSHSGTGLGPWDYATSPSAFYAPGDSLDTHAPRRAQGVASFTVGRALSPER